MDEVQEKLFIDYCNNLYFFMKTMNWYGACHATTAMMFAFAKKLGIDSIACIGECEQKGYKPFDHS